MSFNSEGYWQEDEPEWKGKAVEAVRKTKEWWINNTDTIKQVAPIAIPCVLAVAKATSKHRALAKTERLKTLYCYDHRLGHYWKLKRPLKNRDWLRISNGYKNGEHLGDILASMKVLK